MKKETDENNKLTPYTIGVSHLRKNLTIDEVLSTVFSYEIHKTQPNEEPEEVNELFLLHLAYGVYGIGSYNPKESNSLEPSLVKEKVLKLMELYPSRAEAARIFLTHFEKATEAFGENNSIRRDAKRTLKCINPKPSDKPLPLFPKSDSSKQITAMYHDLQLLQLNVFMKVMYDTISTGKAIPDVNCIIENSRQLYELIKSDITLSTTTSEKKISIYLQVAFHLLENPNIVDLQSVCAISLALSTLPNNYLSKNDELSKKIDALAEIASPCNNYRNIREKMNTKLCIPHYVAIKKDLDTLKDTDVFNQLIHLGERYHYLFNTFNALQTHITKVKMSNPKYLTDLPCLLENADKILQEHKDKKNAQKNKRASLRMSLNLSLSGPKELNFFDSKNNTVSQKGKHAGLSETSSNSKKNEELQNTAPQITPEPKPKFNRKEVKDSDSIPTNRIENFKKRSATFSHHAVYKDKEPLEKRASSLSPLISPSESSLNNNNNEIQNKNASHSDGDIAGTFVVLERRTSPKASERRLAYNNSRGKDQLNPNGFFEATQPELNMHEEKNEVEIEKKAV